MRRRRHQPDCQHLTVTCPATTPPEGGRDGRQLHNRRPVRNPSPLIGGELALRRVDNSDVGPGFERETCSAGKEGSAPPNGCAAVDGEHGADGEARLGAGEPGDGLGDLLRLGHAADRRATVE